MSLARDRTVQMKSKAAMRAEIAKRNRKGEETRDSINAFTTMNDFYGDPEIGGKKCEVFVNASIVLEDVKMADEVFICMIYMEAWWQPFAPEECDDLDLNFITAPWNWEDLFYNAVDEDTLTDASHQWLKDENGEKNVIWGVYHSRVTIPMSVDLSRFPFDRQTFDLRASLDTTHYTVLQKRPAWVPKASKGVTSLANNNDQIIQLRLGEMCEDSYRIKDPIFDLESNSQGVALIRILIERRDEFYWTAVFYPMLTIFIAGLPNCAVPITASGVSDRLGLSGTMFLVVVAFRFTVQELTPEISYSTILDYYMAIATTAVASLIFENAVFGLLLEYGTKGMTAVEIKDMEDSTRYIDLCIHAVFGILWIFLHVVTNCFDNLLHDTWENTLARESGEEDWLPRGDSGTLFGSRYVDESGEPRYTFFYQEGNSGKSGRSRTRQRTEISFDN